MTTTPMWLSGSKYSAAQHNFGQPTILMKTNNQYVNYVPRWNDYQADNTFAFEVAANAVYDINCVFMTAGRGSDTRIAIKWTYPPGTKELEGRTATGAEFTGQSLSTTSMFDATSWQLARKYKVGSCIEDSILSTGTEAGTVTVWMAKGDNYNVSVGMRAGSFIRIRRLQ